MTAETSNARGELRMADIREDAREPLQLLREKLVHDEDGWAALCQLMPMIAAAPPPAAAQQQVQAAADDMGGFSSDTAALAFLSIIGNGNPNVERAVERLRQSLIAQQPAAAEPKTLPVPTRVYLIGETAVIVGTPERGWDEDAKDAHNCDAMGCETIGPHVLARVPFTDERALSQAAEAQGVVDLRKVRNNVLAVIPGGNICDPQQVADDVRAVFAIFEAEARNAR